ncbi:MAG: PIN domain-containing protein [Proteobacteria bacterium]|nr:PIN domain-containing protein [Pseudomonadota bacterium]
MIYLDTHIVVWLYAGDVQKLSLESRKLINSHELYISPIVKLELQYLFEIKRISKQPNEILEDLFKRIGLKRCNQPFIDISNRATEIFWTRDPFDRIIVANASLENKILLTKDMTILDNYQFAKW